MASRWPSLSPLGNPSSRNQVFGQLHTLQEEMNRLFSRWNADGDSTPHYSPGFPAVNVWEDADNVHLEAELPGVDEKALEIYVTGGNQVTIKGDRKATLPEKSIMHRQERGFGTFVRALTLPFNVDRDKVDARFENGILTVKLAKHEAARPRKIKVKSE